MQRAHYAEKNSWFGTRAGRRYVLALALAIAVKIAVLILLYLTLIAPQPRADVSPTAVQRHLLDPADAAVNGVSP
jgi:hypothetical protein